LFTVPLDLPLYILYEYDFYFFPGATSVPNLSELTWQPDHFSAHLNHLRSHALLAVLTFSAVTELHFPEPQLLRPQFLHAELFEFESLESHFPLTLPPAKDFSANLPSEFLDFSSEFFEATEHSLFGAVVAVVR